MSEKIPNVKGFGSKGIGGYKMQRKSWDASEIDPEKEEKKMTFVFLALIIGFVLLAIFMWWMRKTLH